MIRLILNKNKKLTAITPRNQTDQVPFVVGRVLVDEWTTAVTLASATVIGKLTTANLIQWVEHATVLGLTLVLVENFHGNLILESCRWAIEVLTTPAGQPGNLVAHVKSAGLVNASWNDELIVQCEWAIELDHGNIISVFIRIE